MKLNIAKQVSKIYKEINVIDTKLEEYAELLDLCLNNKVESSVEFVIKDVAKVAESKRKIEEKFGDEEIFFVKEEDEVELEGYYGVVEKINTTEMIEFLAFTMAKKRDEKKKLVEKLAKL
jgi:hypothetical protein